jgi:hypothetical protein
VENDPAHVRAVEVVGSLTPRDAEEPPPQRVPGLVRRVRPVLAALCSAPRGDDHGLLHVGAVPARDAPERGEDDGVLRHDRLDARSLPRMSRGRRAARPLPRALHPLLPQAGHTVELTGPGVRARSRLRPARRATRSARPATPASYRSPRSAGCCGRRRSRARSRPRCACG